MRDAVYYNIEIEPLMKSVKVVAKIFSKFASINEAAPQCIRFWLVIDCNAFLFYINSWF